jgi:glycosyltransferase involved in cell wall biosynthesis
MACGTPVVTSTSSSLPEVVGEAGLTADPGDPDAIGAALLRVLRDADLRADLRERGLRQARRFSWRDTAERTLGAYQAAAGSRAPLAEQAGKKER